MTRLRFFPLMLAALCLVVLAFWSPANAAAPAQSSPPLRGKVTQNANLRSGPGTTYAKIGSATAGQTVQVIACNDGCTWYKLDGGSWIFAELVQAQSAAPAAVGTAAPAPASSGKATATGAANLRAGPGTSYARVGSVTARQLLNTVGRNEAGDWYRLADGSWIAAFLVTGAPSDLPVAAAPAAAAALAPQPQQPAAQPQQPTPQPQQPTPQPQPSAPQPQQPQNNCDPSYPTLCIPVGSADLDCGEISARRFSVVGADPHGFDGDNDGVGCES